MRKIFSTLNWKSIITGTGFIIILAFIILVPTCVKALTVSPIRYEISGDPGQVLEEKLNLRNETSASATFYPHYYNFQAEGETGVPSFVEPKDGLGTWIAGPAGITLAPGDNQTVVFVISIPKNTSPGGYFGALLYGTNPPNINGAQLAIGSETGPIILLRVNGDIKESASILDFKIKNDQSFFTALPVEMFYRFQNTGADRTKPTGNLIIRNIFGIKARSQNANPVEGNVLPGQIRHFDLVWQKSNAPSPENYANRSFFEQIGYEWKNFAFGYFTANLDIFYGANNAQNAQAKTKFFVFPWQLLIIVILVIIIVLFVLITLIKRYNRWIIKQAEMAIERAETNNQKKERRQL
jgi:hypothetical protein